MKGNFQEDAKDEAEDEAEDETEGDLTRTRAELSACQSRGNWPTDWILCLIGVLGGIVIGMVAVMAFPVDWKCKLECK